MVAKNWEAKGCQPVYHFSGTAYHYIDASSIEGAGLGAFAGKVFEEKEPVSFLLGTPAVVIDAADSPSGGHFFNDGTELPGGNNLRLTDTGLLLATKRINVGDELLWPYGKVNWAQHAQKKQQEVEAKPPEKRGRGRPKKQLYRR
jgi:hypothetical protein